MTAFQDVLARLRAAFAVTPDDAADVVRASARVPAGLSRRRFLRTALTATVVAATVDIDQLLWTPGERTIFLPYAEGGPWRDNFLLTDDMIVQEGLAILKKNLTFIATINRQYDEKFSYAGRIGDTVTLRIPRLYA